MKTIYVGRFVDTPGPEDLRIRQGAVLVSADDGHGVIEKTAWGVEDEAEAKRTFGLENSADVHVVLLKNDGLRFWFPGFIDTHIHAPQYPNCGIFGKSTLLDWLTTYTFPLEASLGNADSPMYKNSSTPVDPLARARTVYSRVINRTLSHGTTTASYYATLHVPTTNLLAELTFAKGQRSYIGRVCMDRPETCLDYYKDESPEQTLKNTTASIDFCEKLDPTQDLVAPIITPRFAPSLQPQSLTLLGKLANERQIRVQTHISENLNELKLVASLFPDHATYTDVYDAHQLLTERTILAHAIHLSDKEIEIIKKRKSKISHCPASNSALGSGFCHVRKLLDQGLDVGLGTDVSGGYNPSILDAVRQACLVSRHVGFLNEGNSRHNIGTTEGLWLATVGGAKVVGMQGRLGLFEEGMLWDVQEIQTGDSVTSAASEMDLPTDMFGWESWEEKIDKWVWNGDDRNVQQVWVGGRLVHSR